MLGKQDREGIPQIRRNPSQLFRHRGRDTYLKLDGQSGAGLATGIFCIHTS